MLSLWIVAFVAALSFVIQQSLSLKRNIKIAKAVNLPYVLVPLYTATPLWYFCYKSILPVLEHLPTRWTYPWLDFLDPYWSWKLHHEPFARLESDTIMVVAPGGIIFCTCDPNVITEVAGRRSDFCKPIESYVFLDLFGPSLLTREGKSWRAHQRRLAPAFSETNAKLVWEESLAQARSMVDSWCDQHPTGEKHISTIREDTMLLPFHVINKAGFGVDLSWPEINKTRSQTGDLTGADEVSHGHLMSYRKALQTTITHLFHILIFPDWLLRLIPLNYARMLRIAHHECVNHLRELILKKEDELKNGGNISYSKTGIDIMSALITARVERQSASKAEKDAETPEDEEVLTEKAILSNVFIMLIAGHETTATVLLIAMIELALHPKWQRQLQQDLDQMFGDRLPSSWNLNADAEKMFGGTVGATINEVLRLYPPANIIPKGTRPNEPQIIESGEREFTVPGGTAFQFVANSVHRNPKYWPSDPAPPGKPHDLDEFKPQRWFPEISTESSKTRNPTVTAKSGSVERPLEEKSDEILSNDTSTKLFRPFPGSYIPFSTGHRRCIGRRFAQVELLAVFATLFKSHTLDLDVTEFADDEKVARMSDAEKYVVWEQAARRMRKLLKEGMRHHLTMQLSNGKIALRLRKRGDEFFA